MKTAGTQKRQRFLMMLTGAFAIFFTGFPHVWSIYQPYITEGTGWTQSQGAMCFYLALSAFVFGNILGGRMQNRFGPRKVLFLGGGLLSAGILMSAFSLVSSPLPMYLTYGVMQGLGQGMMYTVILAAVSSVMIGSVVNALTRLVLPSLADKVGRIVCIKGVLVIAAAAMILLCFSDSYGAAIAVILIYGCYGGIMGSFPSLTSSVFGIRHAGENYGFVMLGIVIATFGTPVLTRMIDVGENGMRYVFAAGAVFAAAAFVFIEMLRITLNKSDRSDDYGIGNNEKAASAGKK